MASEEVTEVGEEVAMVDVDEVDMEEEDMTKAHQAMLWNWASFLIHAWTTWYVSVRMKKFRTSMLLSTWKINSRLERWMKYLDQSKIFISQ